MRRPGPVGYFLHVVNEQLEACSARIKQCKAQYKIESTIGCVHLQLDDFGREYTVQLLY